MKRISPDCVWVENLTELEVALNAFRQTLLAKQWRRLALWVGGIGMASVVANILLLVAK